MSDDLDFEMEVVENDELGEMGADDTLDSEARSGKENDSSRDEAVGHKEDEMGFGSTGKPSSNSPDVADQRETNPSVRKITVEGWREARADDLMVITRGASPRPKGDPELFGGDIPWVKISDVDVKSERYATKTSDTVTEKGARKSKYIPPGTLIVSNSGTCGYPVFLGMDACVHDGWLILKEYEEDLNADYLYEYITWKQNYLKSLAPGSTQINLNTSRFGSLEIQIPPLPEQRKIASVLYAVDQAIQKTEEIIQQAKRVKRGLMQDLLSRGIDGSENRRDPQSDSFQDTSLGRFPESWDLQPLNSLVTESITYGIVQPGPDIPGGVPFIRSGDATADRLDLDSLQRTSEEIAESYSRSRVNAGEIITTIRATVGESHQIPEVLDGANLGRGVARIVPKEGINRRFLLWAMRSGYMERQFGMYMKGSTYSEITLEQLGKLKVALPEKDEQRRIADVLDAHEQKIQREQQYLSELTRIKKGLMQDLLTGEVRTADKAIDVLDEVAAHG